MPRRTNGDDGIEVYREVGAKIRSARGRRKQLEIADAVKLTRTSITNIEQGRQKILLHTFINIAKVLGVSPHELLPDATSNPGDSAPLELPSGMDIKVRSFVEKAVAKALAEPKRKRSR